MVERYFTMTSCIKVIEAFKEVYLNVPEPKKTTICCLITQFQERSSRPLSVFTVRTAEGRQLRYLKLSRNYIARTTTNFFFITLEFS